MGLLQTKPGVTTSRIAPAGFKILWALQTVADALDLPLTITSGDEGSWRKTTDPHESGEAFDVSIAGFDDATIVALYRGLGKLLPVTQFTVLFEVPTAHKVDPTMSLVLRDIAYWNPAATGRHFHLQRKKGTTYPPGTPSRGPTTVDV